MKFFHTALVQKSEGGKTVMTVNTSTTEAYPTKEEMDEVKKGMRAIICEQDVGTIRLHLRIEHCEDSFQNILFRLIAFSDLTPKDMTL